MGESDLWPGLRPVTDMQTAGSCQVPVVCFATEPGFAQQNVTEDLCFARLLAALVLILTGLLWSLKWQKIKEK